MKSKRRANDESTSCVLYHRSQIYIPQPVASIRAERKESATRVYVRFFGKNNHHYIYIKIKQKHYLVIFNYLLYSGVKNKK